jgi:hypothetical protein
MTSLTLTYDCSPTVVECGAVDAGFGNACRLGCGVGKTHVHLEPTNGAKSGDLRIRDVKSNNARPVVSLTEREMNAPDQNRQQ